MLRQDAPATKLEREVWLWDFGGQADQRLIHQLYMDQTQVAALVFDPQKDDVFETLGQWDRDLSRADKDKTDRDRMTKLLVAGRCDAGSLRVARNQVLYYRQKKQRDRLFFNQELIDRIADRMASTASSALPS